MAGDRTKPCELDQEKYDADDSVKIICLGDSAVGKSKLMERFLVDGFQPQQLSTYALTLYKHTATVDGKTILVGLRRAEESHLQKPEHLVRGASGVPARDPMRRGGQQNRWWGLPRAGARWSVGTQCTPVPLSPSQHRQLQSWSSLWRCSLPGRDLAEPTHSLPQTQIPVDSSENVNCPAFWHGVSANPLSKPIFSLDGQASVLLLFAADLQVTQKSFNFARKFSLPLYFVSAADGTNVVKLFNDAIRLAVSYKQNSQDFMDKVLEELENFKLEPKEEEAPDPKHSGRIKGPPRS